MTQMLAQLETHCYYLQWFVRDGDQISMQDTNPQEANQT
jgi:hypothetical protein